MLSSKRVKLVGYKKKAVNGSRNLVDNIYQHEVSKLLAQGDMTNNSKTLCELIWSNGYQFTQDSRTGETFLHVLCKYIHHYLQPQQCRIFYMLATKMDLNMKDHLGETVLHKVCQVPGAWRCIIALMRCGASPEIRNNLGLTVEEQILRYKNPGWEENLHWLRKFSPGLHAAVTAKNPDTSLIERLLRSWCRTAIISEEGVVCLKRPLADHHNLVCIIEKYENSIEVALSMLSGNTCFIDKIQESVSEISSKVDVNTKDHSYQYYYQDYPTAPRPLLAAVWEIEEVDIVKQLLKLKPDTAVKYTFGAEVTSPPKPLFFQLLNPKSRPRNEEITALILQASDLNIRDEKGQTVLFEAIYNEETYSVLQLILDCGVNIAARDRNGRTARDHCILLGKTHYRELIDSHVTKLVLEHNMEQVESMIIQQYDHLPLEGHKIHQCSTLTQEEDKSFQHLLKNTHHIQATVRKLFSYVKAGNFSQFSKLMIPKFAKARDKAGRSLLHYAIQNSTSVPSGLKKIEAVSPKVINLDIAETIGTMDLGKGLEQPLVVRDTEKLYEKSTKRCTFKDMFGCKPCKPDFLSIIKLLISCFPEMLGARNNLGQTPIYYAHIYSASKEVFECLEKSGNSKPVEDVFGFVPEDYSLHLCGEQTYLSRRKPTTDMDLNIFLAESQFGDRLQTAVQSGRPCKIKSLIDSLLELGGHSVYSSVLFDCLDANHVQLATFLIQKGFSPDITKQYETCNPEDPMCAMMECNHTPTSLRQRAAEMGAADLVNLIDRRLRKNML